MKLLVAISLVAISTIAITADAASRKNQPKSVNIKLECQTYPAPSPIHGSFPEQTATIPADAPKDMVVTGGGCIQTKNNTNRLFASHPSDDGKGWTCQVADFPGTREDSDVQAFVRACHIVASAGR